MIRITESVDSPKSKWLSIEVTFNDATSASIGPTALLSHRSSARDNSNSGGGTATSIVMEQVPRFPAPPTLRSISLDISEPAAAPPPQRSNTASSISSELLAAAARRRARSASWLVARKQQLLSAAPGSSSRRRVRPIIASTTGRASAGGGGTGRHLAAELGFAMSKPMVTSPRGGEEVVDEESGVTEEEEVLEEGSRNLQRIREDHTPRKAKEKRMSDETDVICYATAEVNDEKQLGANPIVRASITHQQQQQRLSPLPIIAPRPMAATPDRRKAMPRYTTTAMQTTNQVLYRLRIFPTLKDTAFNQDKNSNFMVRWLRFLGRLALCQFGLTWLLTVWAVLGASAFYITEGPRERQQVVELKHLQRDLAVNLATELRQLRADDKEIEPLWSAKIKQYVARHEKLLLMAVSSGYGEGGQSGQLWTYPGCVLFSISVLTTLGFGAPVPRTSAGRTVTVLFAIIGIPAHFLLVLNVGLMLAVRLKRYGILSKYREECQSDPLVMDYLPMPMWVKVTPFLGFGIYYTLGIIGFGFARLQPISESLLFPLDFTAAGGLSMIAGHVRVLYGLYLEGAVTLAAFGVAVLKVSATQSLTNIGLRYGLLIPA